MLTWLSSLYGHLRQELWTRGTDCKRKIQGSLCYQYDLMMKIIYIYTIYMYIYIDICHHHHRVVLPARISLTLSRTFSRLVLRATSRNPYIAAECMFELVVLPLLGHMWGSMGVHHLWALPCFSSSVRSFNTYSEFWKKQNDFFRIFP